LEHCSSGGASALPHAALPHASAAFVDIAAQARCAGAPLPWIRSWSGELLEIRRCNRPLAVPQKVDLEIYLV